MIKAQFSDLLWDYFSYEKTVPGLTEQQIKAAILKFPTFGIWLKFLPEEMITKLDFSDLSYKQFENVISGNIFTVCSDKIRLLKPKQIQSALRKFHDIMETPNYNNFFKTEAWLYHCTNEQKF